MEGGQIVDETGVAAPPARATGRGDWIVAAVRYAHRQLEARRTILKFALVGTLGYIIYTGLLVLLYDHHTFGFLPEKQAKVDLLLFTYSDALLLITTIIGTEASIIVVFIGHSLWTFSDWPATPKPLWRRFVEYHLKALVPTLGILTVVVNGLVVGFGLHHYVALPLGFAASFSWNWLWDSRMIWRRRRTSSPES